MFARAMLLALFVGSFSGAGFLAACGGGQKVDAGDSTEEDSKPKHREHPADKDGVSEKGKSWGGWRWKGKRDDCFFVFESKCFETKKQACSEASCGGKACLVESGAPSKVSCEK